MDALYDLAVIGSGPGGYVAALKAASLGARVAVVESAELGGACLNHGCIPSKALLASAELIHRIRGAAELGIRIGGEVSFDWPAIQSRKDKVIAKLRGGIGALFAARQVTRISARGELAGPGRIALTAADGTRRELTARKIILATGSAPARIPGWPTGDDRIVTSDEALHWNSLPARLLIVGGGVIGCEFACMMRAFGVDVTLVELLDSLLPEMERRLGASLAQVFARRGIEVITSTRVEDLRVGGDEISVTLGDGSVRPFDRVLVATGRRARTSDLGLESVGLATDRDFIRVDDTMRTPIDGIFCIGDANGRCLLAHAASAQGETAARNALGEATSFGLPVPMAVYTFPEIAAVGITSAQARRQGIPIRVGEFPIGHLGKAMAVGETLGFVRVLSGAEDNRLLGVHMIGHNATEAIEAATAMLGARASTEDLAEMIFAHPTIGEALKEAAADAWHGAVHRPPRRAMEVFADSLAADPSAV